jgi:predicted PurR-regulated permease PerM
MKRSRKAVPKTVRRLIAVGTLAVVIAGLLAACGASKPAYCSDVTNFKNAVKQLKDVSSPSALVTQAKNVSSAGQSAVNAVKSSFAPQTSAVKTSLAALATSITQLASSGSRATALAAIPGELTAVKTAGENLASAAHSCN